MSNELAVIDYPVASPGCSLLDGCTFAGPLLKLADVIAGDGTAERSDGTRWEYAQCTLSHLIQDRDPRIPAETLRGDGLTVSETSARPSPRPSVAAPALLPGYGGGYVRR